MSTNALGEWSEVSARVRRMYDDYGWSEEGGVTHDADACEDLRAVAAPYVVEVAQFGEGCVVFRCRFEGEFHVIGICGPSL